MALPTVLDASVTSAAPATPASTPASQAKPGKSYAARLKEQAEKSRAERDKKVENEWKQNVQYRIGKPFKEESDEHRSSVPVDWSMTKSKEAGLFSQVPSVILVAKHDRFKPALPVFQKELNDVLTDQCKVGVAMEEVMADKINASGIAGVICGYMATFKTVEVPDQDFSMFGAQAEMMLQAGLANGTVKMLPSKKRVDCRFYTTRLSPSQLLWPLTFKGSDFDDADWVGYDGTCTWAEALREFGTDETRPNGLKPELKEKVCKGAEAAHTLSADSEAETVEGDEMVSYTKLYYWAARQNPDELHLEKIRCVVWVNGIDAPVIDEDFKAQKWDEASESFIGVTKFPLRIGTLTYISDMPAPPSDSEMGRPMTDEAMRSRSQMFLQRDRSYPARWINTNRVDPMIVDSLNRGEGYQRFIPVNGDGTTAIGEVARANYPTENWEFDRVHKQDLMDAWQVGPNQTGTFNTSGRTAAEANIVQGGFATRQAKERAKVSKFFCGIAEVIAGFMQMFYDGPKAAMTTGEDGKKRSDSAWDRKAVAGAKFAFTIREDSSVKLDSQQQLEQAIKVLNIGGKSGFLNVQHYIERIVLLSGEDPAKALTQPNPTPPEPPAVSLRAGGEDLADPIVGPYLIALMQKGPNAVKKEDIEAAKALLVSSSSPQEPLSTLPQPSAAPATPQATPAQTLAPSPKDLAPLDRITKRTSEPGG